MPVGINWLLCVFLFACEIYIQAHISADFQQQQIGDKLNLRPLLMANNLSCFAEC